MLWHESSEKTPLQVTCEWPYVPSNGNGDCKTMKMLPNCFACYKQSDWIEFLVLYLLVSLYPLTECVPPINTDSLTCLHFSLWFCTILAFLSLILVMLSSHWICEILDHLSLIQLLAHGRWFSPGTPASSSTKTGHYDIHVHVAEILLKVALNTKNQSINSLLHFISFLITDSIILHLCTPLFNLI